MLCDFYGRIIIPPQTLQHHRVGFQMAVMEAKDAMEKHGLHDGIVAVEMTGTYHKPVERAFRQGGFETRLVHPFASSFYRPSEHGDVKTDANDLTAIFRAAVNGFGLLECPWDDVYVKLQLLCRHRRDLVRKRARLQPQIRDKLHRCFPGYTEVFGASFWTSGIALPWAMEMAQHGGVEWLLKGGIPQIKAWLRETQRRCRESTLERIYAWAGNAAPADPQLALLMRICHTLVQDWHEKSRQITAVEQEIVGYLVNTPYVLLLSHPGVGVTSAAELAGEMGPVNHYAHAKSISGRAGLFPSRHQSADVDRSGRLSRFRNSRLRRALLAVADNLLKCNDYWRGKYQVWKSRNVDPRDIRVRVANRCTRTFFQMLLGNKLYEHPSRLDRNYVMEKILLFHQKHKMAPTLTVRDLELAATRIPRDKLQEEFHVLRPYCKPKKTKTLQDIGTVLIAVLAKYGIKELQSESEGLES